MNSDDQEMLEKLRLLRHQLTGAIVLMEHHCIAPAPKYSVTRTSPDTFEVGDFIVKNRFVEPRGES